MARVWQATDRVLDRPVAVKVLLDHLAEDRSFVRRFRSEAIAAARLTHPSVVSVYDTCSDDGVEAIVMELVEGPTLRHRLDAEGRLPPREAARIAGRIADALATAHRAGIVHRDIKPANVLLSDDGRVVVTDFGIAKASEHGDLTAGGQMLGTAKYLAPEQVEGTGVDGRADVYALGVVLFEMLCGRVPFLADTEAATALARLGQDPPRPRDLYPDVPADLDRITLRTLARDPADRWPDAASLARSLGAFAAGRPPPADPPLPDRSVAPEPARTPSRDPDPGPDDVDDLDPDEGDLGDRPGPAPMRRGGGALLAIGVVGAALLIVGLLGWRLITPDDAATIAVTATAFDPHGTAGENDDDAPLAVDGDPSTAWSTERYNDPDITVLKPGVGLVLDLGGSRRVERVAVTTDDEGWSAQVFVVAGTPGDDFPADVDAVASVREHDGPARFAVDGAEGDRVVLWITRTGVDGTLAVAEVEVETT
ncbi:MAG: serine/threonine protein kinase [Acidimicrobiales bacterium]|nr:serine/threonine protein kinase [Acidimicrobiales bacterium]